VRLVDSHCHLQADRFAADLELVLGGARMAGIERILVPGWDRPSSEAAVDLVGRHPWLDAAAGIHPHVAAEADDAAWEAVAVLARDPRVVAIGETGLDTDRNFSPLDAQLANLRRHLELARSTGKPAILHCRSRSGERDAQDALVRELRDAGFDDPARLDRFGGRPPAVIHSFSGPLDYAETVIGMGLAVSFSGLVFRAREESSADAAGLVPPDRLLVETDSPYLSPPGAPRRRNEPEWVVVTAVWLGERRGVAADLLGPALVSSYDRVFDRPDRSLPP
jgi:TatD DNase family protein